MGYHRAGFEVIGVDNDQSLEKNYPFEFILADITTLNLAEFEVDVIHASPPCQAYSTSAGKARNSGRTYVDLVTKTREMLEASGLPYIIENVVGSPLLDPIILCGSSFGLNVRRHRLFESNWGLQGLPCDHQWQTPRFQSLDSRMVKKGKLASVVGVHGRCNYAGERKIREEAMGIDWMSSQQLTQAIPPAYTEFIGKQI